MVIFQIAFPHLTPQTTRELGALYHNHRSWLRFSRFIRRLGIVLLHHLGVQLLYCGDRQQFFLEKKRKKIISNYWHSSADLIHTPMGEGSDTCHYLNNQAMIFFKTSVGAEERLEYRNKQLVHVIWLFPCRDSISKIHSASHISQNKQNTSFPGASMGSMWIHPTGHIKEINIIRACQPLYSEDTHPICCPGILGCFQHWGCLWLGQDLLSFGFTRKEVIG